MTEFVPSDQAVLDLLRRNGRMTVSDFQAEMGVTATAVRQRLNRLMGAGYIERKVDDRNCKSRMDVPPNHPSLERFTNAWGRFPCRASSQTCARIKCGTKVSKQMLGAKR